jgi:hypothetical protein
MKKLAAEWKTLDESLKKKYITQHEKQLKEVE